MPLTEPAGVYRPRHPERTVVYRLFEEHFERYVREYEERYEAREGSLRKVVPTAVEAYLACGRLEGGFARIRCPNCWAEHLLAFSCRTRNFCPSCQRLLALLARAARDAIVPSVRAILDRHDATPGLVVSIQTFGSYAANFRPHVHALVTDGAFTEEGEFLQLPYFDARPTPPASPRRDRRTGSVRGARSSGGLTERPRAALQRETGPPSGPYRTDGPGEVCPRDGRLALGNASPWRDRTPDRRLGPPEP